MPGKLLTADATLTCPHQASASLPSPSQRRVTVGGQPVVTAADSHTVGPGCVFMVGTKPQPCVSVRWIQPASRITIGGQPAVLSTSGALCQSAEQAPQGPPSVTVVQQKVDGQ